MQKIISLLILLLSLHINSQNKKTEKILKEGKLLFRLEKGSWYGTDHFLANFKTKKDSIGGYLSYEENNKINTIFFNRFNPNKILVRYMFDSIPRTQPLKIDTVQNKATILEQNLISMREDARKRTSSNQDNFFTFYKKTALNYIPLITKKTRSVFILTGPQISQIVFLGNDYKLSYNKKGEFLKKKKIHNTLLQFPYKSKNKENPITTTIHSHINSNYISSTDICTLLLYKNYVEWNQHIVMSKKQVSIFDLDKESLFTMKKKAWEKISNSKENNKIKY